MRELDWIPGPADVVRMHAREGAGERHGMSGDSATTRPVTGAEAFELAAHRNTPLSVVRPEELGKAPMARGRFLAPEDGAVLVENLQIPGRRVTFKTDQVIEAYFQHDGEIFCFRSRVLEMDTPVRLNDTTVVRAMRITEPAKIIKGNRRSIYRQSFASVNPPVDVEVWAVPLEMLTEEQRAHAHPEKAEEAESDAAGDVAGFRVERSERTHRGLTPAQTLYESVPGLSLEQFRALLSSEPHWKGEIADASEFGLGLTVHRVVYSRLKVFQPLAVRFKLPDVAHPSEFLFEIRRVQGVNDTNARLGGLLLINATSHAEVRASRDLAKFTLDLQRERARRVREAG
ncbi:MAG: flagellar brake protein [Phycisphaerales bacterium]|nr:flagellar brake protein [Phycisphaerales bacterium]